MLTISYLGCLNLIKNREIKDSPPTCLRGLELEQMLMEKRATKINEDHALMASGNGKWLELFFNKFTEGH